MQKGLCVRRCICEETDRDGSRKREKRVKGICTRLDDEDDDDQIFMHYFLVHLFAFFSHEKIFMSEYSHASRIFISFFPHESLLASLQY